jgi:hypothetical protein
VAETGTCLASGRSPVIPQNGGLAAIRCNLGGRLLNRLADPPTFLIIPPKTRIDGFYRGCVGLSATLCNDGAPEGQDNWDGAGYRGAVRAGVPVPCSAGRGHSGPLASPYPVCLACPGGKRTIDARSPLRRCRPSPGGQRSMHREPLICVGSAAARPLSTPLSRVSRFDLPSGRVTRLGVPPLDHQWPVACGCGGRQSVEQLRFESEQ